MTKILISGALGRMGKKVYEACAEKENVIPVCGVDRFEDLSNANFPVFKSFEDVNQQVDVVIDFSSKDNLSSVLEFCKKNKVGAVLCTTGYTDSDISTIKETAKTVPLFRSANMSLGVNILIELVKKAAESLYGFDVEIIEKHHNQKVDAPSGTALMLADAVKEKRENDFYVYGREGIVGKRKNNEIGIHAVRGGNIVGEHDVLFAGLNETLTLSHQATDRSVFAIGAVNAADYLATKESGLYDMSDMLNKR